MDWEKFNGYTEDMKRFNGKIIWVAGKTFSYKNDKIDDGIDFVNLAIFRFSFDRYVFEFEFVGVEKQWDSDCDIVTHYAPFELPEGPKKEVKALWTIYEYKCPECEEEINQLTKQEFENSNKCKCICVCCGSSFIAIKP